MTNQQDMTMAVSTKSPDSRWVALDTRDKVISEGINPTDVISEAEKVSSNFSLMFVPAKGNTYIF